MLKDLVDHKRLKARGVYGIWPAHSEGDDIVIMSEDGGAPLATLYDPPLRLTHPPPFPTTYTHSNTRLTHPPPFPTTYFQPPSSTTLLSPLRTAFPHNPLSGGLLLVPKYLK